MGSEVLEQKGVTLENKDSPDIVQLETEEPEQLQPTVPYRIYKWRFVGLLGMALLNVAGGINAPWFGPISVATAQDFGISLTQVNWLGNSVQLIFIPMSLVTPAINKRLGLRYTCILGAVLMVVGSWLRVAATPHSLSPQGAYALFLIGQIVVGLSQPIFLALGPYYSEQWFNLKGRTTATMVVSVANPIGTAIGQILSPVASSPRSSILILAIISSVLALPVFLIKSKPPTPPTFSGTKSSLGPMVTVRAMLSRARPGEPQMSSREKLDFIILTVGFGIYVAATIVFSLLSNQIMEPQGYSENTAGFFGAALILSGLVCAIITAPLFDRVLTYHMGLTIRCMTPFLGVGWFSLIWAVRPNNEGALFAVFVIIGMTSVTLLPLTLELASEVTRNSDTSAAFLWCSGNLFGFIFVLVQNALRDGPDANPPLNMKRATIFNGVVVLAWTFCVQLLRGRQVRRKLDEQMDIKAPTPATS